MKNYIIILSILTALIACNSKVDTAKLKEECKAQIVQTEKDFEKMAAEKGVAEAFAFYAADSAVINRGAYLNFGKTEIKDHYLKWKFKEVSLKWSPDFVDVAASGDLGYTYGKFTFSATDTTGTKIEDKGYFHTVWKKQADGNWKYVWD
jgi:ketosteroid isomerase-like protein